MDKSWMEEKRETPQFVEGFNNFLEFALKNCSDPEKIRCPCIDCGIISKGNISMLKNHVFCRGIDKSYTKWYWHGESMKGDPYPLELLDDAQEEFIHYPENFDSMVRDADKSLFSGCEKRRLSTMVKFYNIKAENGVSDKCFSQFLSAFKEILPMENFFPESTYEVKKTLSSIGLKYEKIHACPNDCILYRKEHAHVDTCSECGLPRYKPNKRKEIQKLIPEKVLWYLPLIPRLKRFYRSAKTSENLLWHEKRRVKDGKLRHPADSQAWKKVNYLNPNFAAEPRHLRLGLSADGVNPHRSLSSRHSSWPVFLVMYNLPPWLLYEDGADGYDGFKKQVFKLKVVLLWTVSDFPAYSNLSGLSTKGYEGCPICCTNTRARRLSNGRKMCYMGHRRYLPISHPDRNKKQAFDGTVEREVAPLPLSGRQILEEVEKIDFKYGRILFGLDVMHIEKNVCESIGGTLLDIPGKSKDGLSSRLDLVELGIRHSLAPVDKGKRTYLPPTAFTLSKEEKQAVCNSFSKMKVPDGYSSNVRNLVCMEELKLMGMKSHDCHTLMQQLLPIAIRSVLPKKVRQTLTKVFIFFNQLCGKELEMKKLNSLHDDIVKTLCNLEKYFPPSFFDIMIHLMVHLVREAKLCGPVWARWMYPFEGNMKRRQWNFVRST
ncbi:hypothetical protein CsatB_014668 [Cannabis sativa]